MARWGFCELWIWDGVSRVWCNLIRVEVDSSRWPSTLDRLRDYYKARGKCTACAMGVIDYQEKLKLRAFYAQSMEMRFIGPEGITALDFECDGGIN